MNLKIHFEYEKLLPKLSKQDYEKLKESIRQNGLYEAITVNREGFILDGYHRFRACQELGVMPKVEVKDFANQLDEKFFVIEANLNRRHLNEFQRAELGLVLLEIERERAKQRKGMRTDLTSCSNEHQVEFGKARDIVAKKVGLSPTTFQRALKIIERGSEKLKEKCRKGQVSITFAYKTVKNKDKPPTPPLPEGKFSVIYADPPWEYYLPLRGSPDMHYHVMSTEEICKLKVPASEDAVLFLWATNPKLEDALQVMKAWGFTYKTNMVWVKDKIGTGYYFRGQHELLLIGTKGKIGVPTEESRQPSVLFSPAREHSSKPVEVYDIIERMYPNQKAYLELFARAKIKRERWVYWGLKNISTES